MAPCETQGGKSFSPPGLLLDLHPLSPKPSPTCSPSPCPWAMSTPVSEPRVLASCSPQFTRIHWRAEEVKVHSCADSMYLFSTWRLRPSLSTAPVSFASGQQSSSVVCELLPSSEHPTEEPQAGEPHPSREDDTRNFPVSAGSGIPRPRHAVRGAGIRCTGRFPDVLA